MVGLFRWETKVEMKIVVWLKEILYLHLYIRIIDCITLKLFYSNDNMIYIHTVSIEFLSRTCVHGLLLSIWKALFIQKIFAPLYVYST